MPLIGALVIKEFQTWLRGRLTFAAFTLLVLLVALLVFLLGVLILAPDANAAPALFSTTSTTSTNLLVANRAIFLFGAVGCASFWPPPLSPPRCILQPSLANASVAHSIATVTAVRDGWRPPGPLRLSSSTLIEDPGTPDEGDPDAQEHPVRVAAGDAALSVEQPVLRRATGDRILRARCGPSKPGWSRVHAICGWVNWKWPSATSTLAPRRLPWMCLPSALACAAISSIWRYVLPRPEHSGPLCHGIPGRHRCTRRAARPWISAPGSKSICKTAGGRLTRAMCNHVLGES